MLDGIITSFIDGRVRVRHSALKKAANAAKTHDALMRTPGVRKAEINTNTGSLLLEYDPKQLSRVELLQMAEKMKEGLAEDEEPALSRRKGRLLTPAQVRHLTNRGMILTLGASVGFALAGRMGAHVALGWGFLALNALHLYRYRRCI